MRFLQHGCRMMLKKATKPLPERKIVPESRQICACAHAPITKPLDCFTLPCESIADSALKRGIALWSGQAMQSLRIAAPNGFVAQII
jgi:hypothetical protein